MDLKDLSARKCEHRAVLKDLSTRKCEHRAVYREVFHFFVLRSFKSMHHEHESGNCLTLRHDK